MAQTFDYRTLKPHNGAMRSMERQLIVDLSTSVSLYFHPQIVQILHIGVEHGVSLFCSRHGAPKANILGVDIVGDAWLNSSSTPEMLAELNATIIKGDSKIVHDQVQAPIHFLFVDGDHTYDGVKADIENWAPKVTLTHGVIAFHDAYLSPMREGVFQAIEECLDNHLWSELLEVDSIRYFYRR